MIRGIVVSETGVELKEVDEAQTKLVQLTKDLAEKGEIVLSKGSAEDELVY